MINKVIAGEYVASRIKEDYLFRKSIGANRLKAVEGFLNTIKNGLNNYGIAFLLAKKNVKQLVGSKANDTWELRSKIKGHRILFKFAYQFKEDLTLEVDAKYKFSKFNDYDVVLLKYIDEHDETAKVAKRMRGKKITLFVSQDDAIETSISQDNINNASITRIYDYKNINYLLPIFSEQQIKIINDARQYVLVQGIAGSGKTNLCIQKCLVEALKQTNNKVLYSTFSSDLLEDTKTFVKENYIKPLQEIINEFDNPEVNHQVIEAMKNNLDLNLNYIENTAEEFAKIKNKLDSIDYKLIHEINNIKPKSELLEQERFEYFYNFIKQTLPYDLQEQIKKLRLSVEVIYKELQGVVLGMAKSDTNSNNNFVSSIIDLQDYKQIRANDFDVKQLELIYKISKKYLDELLSGEHKKELDKNLIAFNITQNQSLKEVYDIVVLDEVQDFTQKEIKAFKHLSKKIFAVGDTRQMINPSYFSFDELKRLLGINYEQYKLELNYRNTENLNVAVKSLISLGNEHFGTWNDFSNQIKSNKTNDSSNLCYLEHSEVLHKLLQTDLDNYVIIVPSAEEKERFNNINSKFTKTIAEYKGRETDVIILYNILSAYEHQWNEVAKGIEHKQAKVNSLYRHYYNIFYVGITRAKRHLLIVEDSAPQMFVEYFDTNFKKFNKDVSISLLKQHLGLETYDDEKRMQIINDYLNKQKYEDAQYNINILKEPANKQKMTNKFNVYFDYVKNGLFKEARDYFLDNDFYEDAIIMCDKMGEENDGILLKNILLEEQRMAFKTLLKIYFSTNSSFIKKLTQKELQKQRQELFEKSQVIKELLKELNNG